MSGIDFQKLYETLDRVLPDSWNTVIFRAEYHDGSYTMKFYVKNPSGKYVDCYSLSEIEEDDIVDTYIEIDKILYPERQKLAEGKRWSALTFIIGDDGNFTTDFSYADLDSGYDEFITEWKKKYLS